MIRIFGAFAILIGLGSAAGAQSMESQIRSQLRAQGYNNIIIERERGRIEVGARRGGNRIELKFDARTGRLISQRAERVGGRTVYRNDDDDDGRNRRARGGRDDDDDDGRGRGRSRSNDDDDDRGGGRSRGNDDDDDGGRSRGNDDDD